MKHITQYYTVYKTREGSPSVAKVTTHMPYNDTYICIFESEIHSFIFKV
jgi:hypothetical protein